VVVKQLIKHLTTVVVGLALLFSQYTLALTIVTASVDKNPVTIKESLVLTIIADDDVNANALDTSILLDNFIVGRTSVSTQTSMINFKTSRTTRWSTVLVARKTGKINIPSFSIENNQTTPIEITVLAADDNNGVKQQDIFITNEISSNNIYVQQSLTLTVKLHFSTELKRGNLSEPTLIGANIAQIGKDQESEQLINGKRFRVIARTYAINPQESGEFNLLSPRFSGEIMMQSTRRSNFINYAETKPVSVVGDDITLTVRPIPVAYQGQWLPTEILTLHQEWQPDLNNFKVGEPITRSITLTVAGLSKEQLPKLVVDVPRGLKVYPDQAELHSSLNKDRLVSQQVQSFAIVASRAGTYELPAITIPWFNTVTNKIEQAQLAAQKIIVHANADFPEETPNSNNNNAITPSPSEQLENTKITDTLVVQNYWLQWTFLALWLLTSFAWLMSTLLNRKNNHSSLAAKSRGASNESNITHAYETLIGDCKSNQAEQVLAGIVPWVNNLSGKKYSTTSLSQAVETLNNKDIEKEITLLQQSIYGKNPSNKQSSWQGGHLLLLIKDINKKGIIMGNLSELNINP
jgi:hypothetical protein